MKNILVTLGLTLALVLSVVGIVTDQKSVVVSGVSSPDIQSPYFSYGGVRFWAARAGLAQATTTVCAIQAPVATSTLIGGSVSFSVSSTSASTVTVAKATTAFATTTLLRTSSVSANAQAQFSLASTTSSASTAALTLDQSNRVFAPNEWLVVGMAGGVGTFSPTGSCSAEWEQMAY